MSDDETPYTPGAGDGTDAAKPEDPEARAEKPTGGKLIHADVFLSRLAERQEGRNLAAGEEVVIDAILGALESVGLDPDTVAPDFVRMARAGSQVDEAPPATDDEAPALEEMAVEDLFLSELRTGRQPSLAAYMRRHAAQRDALLRLAMRMDPRELAGGEALEDLTPEQDAEARAGQDEGTRRALRQTSKRGRGDGRRVAEERIAYYTAGEPDGEGEAKPKRNRKRARPARPEQTGPES